MRKLSSLAFLIILTLLGFSISGTASASILDGGGGAGSGGSSGSGFSYGWGAGSSLYDYAYVNKPYANIPWGLSPVYGMSEPAGSGGAGITDAVNRIQGGCAAANVKAVFGAQYIANTRQWKQLIKPVNPNNTPGGTYGTLLNIYKSNIGNDPSVIAQLTSVKNQNLPLRSVFCVTTDNQTRWIDVPVYTPEKTSQSITCVYSRVVSVNRQISALDANGNLIDPIGNNNLEDQTPVIQKTSYGNLFDSYTTSKTPPDPATAIKNLQTACNADKKAPHSRIDLSANNKAGMAEGGVLNIKESTKNATYTSSQSTGKLTSCTSYEEVSKDGGKTWTPDGKTQNKCVNPHPATQPPGAIIKTAQIDVTLKVAGFWQMISVHCNQDGFNALAKSTNGITVVNTGDPTKKISAAAYSNTYPAIPTHLDFGDPTNTNQANAASGSKGFFDKECPYDCKANANDPSANSNNGASSNVGSTKPNGGTVGKYGAVSGGSNNNKFTFFRDNQPKKITLDVWYPASGGVVNYNGSTPLTTTVSRWAQGTPSIDGSDGGQFTMKTADGQNVFSNGGDILNQRDWDPVPGVTPDSAYLFNTPTSAMLKGLQRTFTVQSTFASVPGKPEVINVKWEYAPTVSTSIATTGLGFNVDGSGTFASENVVTANIQGKCYANYGSTTSVDTSSSVIKNTGTGTTNNLDGHLLQGDNPNDNQTNLLLTFVRSTTE